MQVRLRAYLPSHAPSLFEAARESIDAVYPWLDWCHPDYQPSDAREWIETQVRRFEERTEFAFAVESAEGRFLGGCGLNQINSTHQFANLGYWIRTSEVGRGLAPEAVRTLADWAFSNTDLVRLEIVVAVANEKSQRVACKAGAIREGVLRKRLQIRGTWHDAALFAITRSSAPGT